MKQGVRTSQFCTMEKVFTHACAAEVELPAPNAFSIGVRNSGT